jgi:hypothetical protein
MTIRKFAAAAIAGFALVTSVAPVMAQYYPYPQQQYRPNYGPGPGYGGPGYGGQDYYYTPRRRVAYGDICSTSRGACQTSPTPAGSPCRCKIPGFGKKQGVIVVQRGW